MNDINKEIEEMSEKMETTHQDTEFSAEIIKSTIRQLGAEGLKKALPTLSDEQKELLKSVIEDMKKGKNDLEPKVNTTESGNELENEKHEFTGHDEELADEAKKRDQQKVRQQGGVPIEGWEGQEIGEEPKKSEMPSNPSDVKLPAIMKSEMSKEDASKKIMAMEEKEHKTKDPKKLVEAEKKEHMEKGEAYGHEGDQMMKNKEESMEPKKEMSPEEMEKKAARKAMKKAMKKCMKKALKKAMKIEAKGEDFYALKEKKKMAKSNLKKMMSRMQEQKMEKSKCVTALAKSLGADESKISALWDVMEKSMSYKFDDGTVGEATPEAKQVTPAPIVKDEMAAKVSDPASPEVPAYSDKSAKKADAKKPMSGESKQLADEGEQPPQTMKKSDGFFHDEEPMYIAKSESNPFASRTIKPNAHYAVDEFIELDEASKKGRLAKSTFDYESTEEILAKAKKKMKAEKLKKDGTEITAEGPKEAIEQDKLPEIMKKTKKMKKSMINDIIEKSLDLDQTSVEQAQANVVHRPSGANVKSFDDAEMDALFSQKDMWNNEKK